MNNALTIVERAASALTSMTHEDAIRALIAKSAGISEVKNKDGRDQCHAAMMALKTARTNIEKAGKAAREDATAFSRAVIAEEKRLIELAEPEERRLAALRNAWDEKIKAEKEAKEAAARARIASLQSAIELIRGAAISMTGKSSEEVEAQIDATKAIEIGDRFEEFTAEAKAAKAYAMSSLGDLLIRTLAQESEAARIKAEREELARLKAEAAERERIAEEKAESERKAAAAARAAEDASIARERAAAQREIDEANRKAAAERAEADRLAAAARAAEQAKIDAERAELARQQREAEAERQRIDRERKAAEVEAWRLESIRVERIRDASDLMLEALERISEWDGFARMPDEIREKVDAAVSQATGVSL